MEEMTAWLAVRAAKEDALRALALEDTGAAPAGRERQIKGGVLDGGWYVVQVNDPNHWLGLGYIARKLSRLGPTVGCRAWHEQSEAFVFEADQNTWALRVESGRIEASGTPPAELAALEASARARPSPKLANTVQELARLSARGRSGQPLQVEDPLAQVPLQLAARACGREGAEPAFSVLRESRDARLRMGESWLRAGAQLGLRVSAPFVLQLPDAQAIEAPALVHNSRGTGTLIVLDSDVLQSRLDRIFGAGYGFWTSDARDTCEGWDIERFRRVLRDLGHLGPAPAPR